MRLLIRECGVHTQSWAALPGHLLQHVFAHCMHSNFVALSLVCRAWRAEIHRESWRRFCKLEKIATDWINANKSLHLAFSETVSTWIKTRNPVQFLPCTIRLISTLPRTKLRLARPHAVVLLGPRHNKVVKFALATLPVTHQTNILCPTGTIEIWF